MYIKSNIHESELVFIHYTNSFSKMQLSKRPVLMWVRKDELHSLLHGRKEAAMEGGKLSRLPWGPTVWESSPSCAEALKERQLPLPSVQREGKASCWRGRAVSLSASLELSCGSGSMVWCRKTWKMSACYELWVWVTRLCESCGLREEDGFLLLTQGMLCACIQCRAGLWEVQLFVTGAVGSAASVPVSTFCNTSLAKSVFLVSFFFHVISFNCPSRALLVRWHLYAQRTSK